MVVDKSELEGQFKAWKYQHGILDRILLAYEFPLSWLKGLERKFSHHLHRWFGLPKNLSSICEVFMIIRAKKVLQSKGQGPIWTAL